MDHFPAYHRNVRLLVAEFARQAAEMEALTCRAEKLRLDFAREPSMCTDMQLYPLRDHQELIASLCLEAGRIMEDESTALALVLPASAALVDTRLETARQAGEDIATLAAAAQVLLRRGEASS